MIKVYLRLSKSRLREGSHTRELVPWAVGSESPPPQHDGSIGPMRSRLAQTTQFDTQDSAVSFSCLIGAHSSIQKDILLTSSWLSTAFSAHKKPVSHSRYPHRASPSPHQQIPISHISTMFPALIKHQIVKPSAFHITRVARASVSGKTLPSTTGSEECKLQNSISLRQIH